MHLGHKLIKAVSDAFPNTKLLRCVMHFLSNLNDHHKGAGAEKVVRDLQYVFQSPYEDFNNLFEGLVSKYHEHASLINFLLKNLVILFTLLFTLTITVGHYSIQTHQRVSTSNSRNSIDSKQKLWQNSWNHTNLSRNVKKAK